MSSFSRASTRRWKLCWATLHDDSSRGHRISCLSLTPPRTRRRLASLTAANFLADGLFVLNLIEFGCKTRTLLCGRIILAAIDLGQESHR